MEAINFSSRFRGNAQPPKSRSIASRCSEAARGLGFTARTLAYRDSDESRYLYNQDTPVFECYGWEELLEELCKRGARIPTDYWEEKILHEEGRDV